jgi:hypothetical protein
MCGTFEKSMSTITTLTSSANSSNDCMRRAKATPSVS